MQLVEKVFIIFFSQDDTRPFIEEEYNKHMDWTSLSQFIDGTKSSQDYIPVEFSVNHPDATEFDFYKCNGRHDVFSEKAVRLLGNNAFQNYHLFPAKINGENYYILSKCLAENDCLDRDNSIYVECEPPEKLLFSIAKYSFKIEKIVANRIFSIPESSYIFCTQVLADTINNGLNGFGLIEVSNSKFKILYYFAMFAFLGL